MKKKILLILISIIILYFGYTQIKIFFYKSSIKNISNLNYKEYVLDKTNFYNSGELNCFILFKTDNEDSYNQIEDFVDNIERFKNVNFYLVSNESSELLIEFHEDSDYEGLENFTVLQDKENQIFDFFDSQYFPSTYLYNKSGKLINYSLGYTDKVINLIE